MGQEKPQDRFIDSVWCLYLCAVAAACHTELYTFPLDLVKTRLQIQGEKAAKLGAGPHHGMLKTGLLIVKEEGILGLWKGISAIFARHSIYAGMRIVVYKESKDFFQRRSPDAKVLPMWQLITCGMLTGFIAQLVASPADLVKVQFQMEGKRRMMGLPPRVTGLVDAFKKVYAVGGIRGMWIGWIPNVQRSILVNLGDFTTYDVSKRAIQKRTNLPDNIILHGAASLCAGFVGAILSTPADVIKSRVMNQPVDDKGKGLIYKGTWDCFKRTVTEEGFFAMYKGFVPAWIRLGPWAVIYWLSYEHIRILLGAGTF